MLNVFFSDWGEALEKDPINDLKNYMRKLKRQFIFWFAVSYLILIHGCVSFFRSPSLISLFWVILGLNSIALIKIYVHIKVCQTRILYELRRK